MKQRAPLVFSFSLLILFIFTVTASSSFGVDLDSYVALKAGVYSPQEDPFKDFDNGLNGEISVGAYFTPNFALELGVGYFESEGSGAIVAPGPVIVPAEGKITVIPITVNTKYLYPVGGAEPYAEAGIGVYVADAELSGGGFDLSDRYTNVGVFLGLGCNINISRNIFLGIEGRYHWVAEHKFTLGQATRDVEIDGFTATANLGYRYGIGLHGE